MKKFMMQSIWIRIFAQEYQFNKGCFSFVVLHTNNSIIEKNTKLIQRKEKVRVINWRLFYWRNKWFRRNFSKFLHSSSFPSFLPFSHLYCLCISSVSVENSQDEFQKLKSHPTTPTKNEKSLPIYILIWLQFSIAKGQETAAIPNVNSILRLDFSEFIW